jgi:hypothetical protein
MISGQGTGVAVGRPGAGRNFDWVINADRFAALRPRAAVSNWLSNIASAVVVGLALYAVRGVDLTMLWLPLSASGLFWFAFVANYFHAPFAGAVILGRLWAWPRGLFPVLCRKQIVNAVAMPLAGDSLLLAWAHARDIRGFGAIKDAAILSGIAGSIVTFMIILPVWQPLSAALGIAPASLFGSLSLLSAFPLIALFKRADVFALAGPELCRIGALHATRIIANIVLLAFCWHLLLPAEPIQSWLMLAAARMVVSRLPLLPNKELVLAAVAATMFPGSPQVGAVVIVTGLLLTLTHLIVWFALGVGNGRGTALRANVT